MDAGDMGTDLKEVLISEEQLAQRLAELAAQIDADYAGRELLLVGVLKGAVMVMADLARAMHLPVRWTGWRSPRTARAPVLRRGPHPQGPGHRHLRPARADRRGHHRLRADPVLAGREPAVARPGLGRGLHAAAQAGAAQMPMSRSSTSASTSPTSSSSATGWTTPSGIAICPSSGLSPPTSTGGTEPNRRSVDRARLRQGGPAGGRRDVRLVRRERPLAGGRSSMDPKRSFRMLGLFALAVLVVVVLFNLANSGSSYQQADTSQSSSSSTRVRSSRRRSPTRTRPSR